MKDAAGLIDELEALLAGAGLALVELSVARKASSVRARLTVYAPGGTGTDECSKAYRLVYPRLLSALGVEEAFLEVSSPGLDRIIKDRREWKIFAGRAVRLLLKSGGEWIRGVIVKAEAEHLFIDEGGVERSIPFDALAQARLDSSQGGKTSHGF